MKVESEQLGIEDACEAVDGGAEALGIELFRQIADHRALAIVRDSKAVTEHAQERLLGSHQIGLQQLFADGVAGVELEGFVDPRVLIAERFFLDENRTQLAVRGESGDCGFVNIAVVGAEPIEDFSDQGGIDGGVNFVGFHGGQGCDVGGSQGPCSHCGKVGARENLTTSQQVSRSYGRQADQVKTVAITINNRMVLWVITTK